MKRICVALPFLMGCVAVCLTSCAGNDGVDDALEQQEKQQQEEETVLDCQSLLDAASYNNYYSMGDGGYWTESGQYELATEWTEANSEKYKYLTNWTEICNGGYRVEVYAKTDKEITDGSAITIEMEILIYKHDDIVYEFPAQTVEGNYILIETSSSIMIGFRKKDNSQIHFWQRDVKIYIPSIVEKNGTVIKNLTFTYRGILEADKMKSDILNEWKYE